MDKFEGKLSFVIVRLKFVTSAVQASSNGRAYDSTACIAGGIVGEGDLAAEPLYQSSESWRRSRHERRSREKYDSTQLRRQLKFHFTSNHTQSDWTSLEGHSSWSIFGEKQEVSDQLPQRFHQFTASVIRSFVSFLLFRSETCVLEGSYFWKHLRHFCWRNLIKLKLKAKEGKNPICSSFSR